VHQQLLHLLNVPVALVMHESIITYIKNYSTTPLTETEIEVIKDVFVPKKIRKRPPLRERIEDVPVLAYHFINIYNRKSGKRVTGLSDKVLKNMIAYSWPEIFVNLKT